MQIISDIPVLREQRREWQASAKVIAFVPTMGNLHQGHLNLVREAKKHADIVVVSIFVNPMQFGPDEDLDAYPRTLNDDAAKLEALDVSVLFVPKVSDIYARGLEQQTFVEVPGISYMICGASRPGHFRGVATIVCKLFNMVQPNLAFFGEKDFQQLQVIKAMVTDLSMNLQVIGVATTRESDGLAMSSRNQYLNAEQRALAPILYEQLTIIASAIEQGRRDFSMLVSLGKQHLAELGFNPDYIEIRNAENLLPPGHEDTQLVILAAAFLGKTRLIDNIQIQL
ncbi:MAG: pantoate--beta-alanine ligase [Paraglaciecola sp.]|uniref:pantoate--beta-alanine ligase n=1 Tax=Paraglaciecola sp. TaxID=1920173 RepID=UPI00273F7447|nr:pantoate--beta-alanine ligase [Paraglaciecola sp.]MDP5030094.1 pantoate--beta-alanine ligase [Paraglaciecola sp.]MDP5040263.1 pantoate--beta-alanine ligase [Paraglaciecola sp.]MDP5130493.1 pantoate--beta-alanine ligase [Paraglaciecola sp.]